MKRPACSGWYGYWNCQRQRWPERGGSMAKILAVDDSASMRGMVAFTLRGAGHEVTEAENGQLALDAARGSAFELVLADVNMPVMDGIAMVRQLRALDAYKIGRAHVCTPVTNAHLVCRLLLEQKKT